MSQQQLAIAKFSAIFVVLVGGFVLVGVGKLDAGAMYQQTATLVAALVVALGISGAGSAAGGAITGVMRHMAALREPDQVKRVGTGVGLVLGLLFAARLLTACTAAQAVGVIVPGVDFAVCVLTVASTDADAQPPVPVPQVIGDVLAKCGGDVGSIATVLDADANANAASNHAAAFHTFAAAARASKAAH